MSCTSLTNFRGTGSGHVAQGLPKKALIFIQMWGFCVVSGQKLPRPSHQDPSNRPGNAISNYIFVGQQVPTQLKKIPTWLTKRHARQARTRVTPGVRKDPAPRDGTDGVGVDSRGRSLRHSRLNGRYNDSRKLRDSVQLVLGAHLCTPPLNIRREKGQEHDM